MPFSYVSFWLSIYVLSSGVDCMCSCKLVKTTCLLHVVFIHSCFLYSAVADLIKYAAHHSECLEGLIELTEIQNHSIKKNFHSYVMAQYIYFCCIKIILLIYLA